MSSKLLIAALMGASVTLSVNAAVREDTPAEITKNSQNALASLYSKVPGAKALGAQAHAILVFPKVTKAGLGIGGQHGEGALLKDGKAIGYYKTTGASVGLQAGAQTYGYAMFFMNDAALKQLDKADGSRPPRRVAASYWLNGWYDAIFHVPSFRTQRRPSVPPLSTRNVNRTP